MSDEGRAAAGSRALLSLSRWLGPVGRNATFTTAGLAARAAIQAVYLIVLSRWLEPSGYGLFSGSLVASTLVAPLSGWGISYLLMREVANDRARAKVWMGIALLRIALSGAVFTAAVLLVGIFTLDTRVDFASMAMLALAELVALPGAQAISRAFVALDQGLNAALNICVVPACRMLGVIACLVAGVPGDPARAAAIHFSASVIGLLLAVVSFAVANGWPRWSWASSTRGLTREGTGYALGSLVTLSYPEIDKVLLLQVLGPVITGNYTVAFRVMSVLVVPLTALVTAALPRLFAASDELARSQILRRVILASVAYACLAVVLGASAAPLMTSVFGKTYTSAAGYMLLLSPWALGYAIHQCAGLALTVSGHQTLRVSIEGVGLALITLLNLMLLRRLGAEAAILILLAAELLMTVACWWFYRRRRRYAASLDLAKAARSTA